MVPIWDQCFPCILAESVIWWQWYPSGYQVLPIYGRRFAPLRGQLLLPPDLRKGAVLMVTYTDLIQIGILVVGIIGLFLQTKKK